MGSIILPFILLSCCCTTIIGSSSVSLEKKNMLPQKVALEDVFNKDAIDNQKKSSMQGASLDDTFSSNTLHITAEHVDKINNGNKKWRVRFFLLRSRSNLQILYLF